MAIEASAHTGELAAGVARLGTETAFSVLARARAMERAGRDVIHLEIGEPDFDTPAHITEAGIAALRAGETHYCPAAGIPELRDAAAHELSRTRGLEIAPDRVLVANGAKPFLFFTILATCQPGDEVIYPDPGFPIYESVIRWVGAVPVPLPILEEEGFAFTAEQQNLRLRKGWGNSETDRRLSAASREARWPGALLPRCPRSLSLTVRSRW